MMRCVICGYPLDTSLQLVLPTTDGQYVHLLCAEREASVAARKRTIRAAVSTVLLIILVGLVFKIRMPNSLYVAFIVVLSIFHLLINRRWWYYMAQLIRWWRWK
jgi:hypothetical protein